MPRVVSEGRDLHLVGRAFRRRAADGAGARGGSLPCAPGRLRGEEAPPPGGHRPWVRVRHRLLGGEPAGRPRWVPDQRGRPGRLVTVTAGERDDSHHQLLATRWYWESSSSDRFCPPSRANSSVGFDQVLRSGGLPAVVGDGVEMEGAGEGHLVGVVAGKGRREPGCDPVTQLGRTF